MAAVVLDIIDGDLQRTSDGWRHVRVAKVLNLDAGAPAAKLHGATIASGLPQYGDAHPVISGIQVTDVFAASEAGEANSFAVRLTYSVPDERQQAEAAGGFGPVSVSWSGTTYEELATRDINGRPLYVRYSGPAVTFNAAGGITSEGGFFRFTHRADGRIQRPIQNATATRYEPQLPRSTRDLIGLINSSRWSGDAAGEWLCTGIDAFPEDGGRFRVAYQFSRDPRGWQLEAVVQGIGSTVPSEITLGNGIERFEMYHRGDFSRFGFELI